MKIPIKTDSKKYYVQVLNLLRDFFPFNKLRGKEFDVLGEILYQNHKYKNVPFEERMILVFSKDNKIAMAKNLKINRTSLYNYMKEIRAKGFIGYDTINEKIMFDYDTHKSITFEFNE